MKRRDFLRKSFQAGILSSTVLSAADLSNLWAMSKDPKYDLVAIKGAEAEDMFDKGIASLGGMKAFVKKGQTVVVKPNIGWDVIPEHAANTNPKLVHRIVKRCFEAGAKKVFVFDNTCDNWNKCYSNSGIQKAASDAGATVVTGSSESHYHEVEVKGGKKLKSAKVHELILESDVFINVPILKHHSSSNATISMKNLMGIVWDRGYWHQNNLHQCIADMVTYRKPDLNIVDAYRVLKRNGPRGVSGEDVLTLKSQIISTDIVAADSAAAKLFGFDPSNINHIKIANDMKLGVMDLDKLSINRIKMS
jgi:uncharacterized protein (DUF362 family)